ncbi:hypothetical protein GRJ2_002959600 [Grus japonensis]|uniref:Uncharacterized protein n=1 Tax=Grus japonensis TaxID=30415 RepID=A0ABC9Y4G5_GRUJA
MDQWRKRKVSQQTYENNPKWILEEERGNHQHHHHLLPGKGLQMLAAHGNIPHDHHQSETTRTQGSSGRIPLQGLLSLERVNSTSQFGIIDKLANDAFNSCLQITDKDIDQDWP